jgi:hypothetical protein
MKRLLKSVARSGWRLTGPIRRPLGRKVDAKLTRVVSVVVDGIVREHIQGQIHPRLDALEQNVWAGRGEVNAHASDTNLTLDSLVREIGRLQVQVEVLQGSLVERTEDSRRLALIAEEEGDEPGDEARAKVG